jgi:hypothetical protein
LFRVSETLASQCTNTKNSSQHHRFNRRAAWLQQRGATSQVRVEVPDTFQHYLPAFGQPWKQLP